MKKNGAFVALICAVLFGALAVVLVNNLLSSRVQEEGQITKQTIPLSEVVIAAKDINVGMPLNENNLALAEWPKANIPQGSFKNIQDLEGRVAITPLTAGQPLRAAELAAPGSGAGLVAIIPPGMRAMSIKVDEVIGVAGFILPNTFVDVIGVDSKNKKETAKTILKNIKVLAIAQETFTEDGKAKIVRTVTLQVKPVESERLALQTHKGGIHLVLRNPLEKERIEPVVVKNIGDGEKEKIAVLRPRIYSPKPSPHSVEIIRGSEFEDVRFANVESTVRLR